MHGYKMALLAALLVPAPGWASLISYESFSNYTAGSLSGQGIQGTGYSAGGSWFTGGGDASAAPGSLGYSDGSQTLITRGGKAVTPAGGFNTMFAAVDTANGGAFGSQGYVESGSGQIGSGNVAATLYLGFLARNASSDLGGGEDFAALELYRDGNEVLGAGNNWPAWAYSTFGLTGDADLVRPSDNSWLTLDSAAHFFIVKLQFNAAANDDVSVWMDPDLDAGELGQPTSVYRNTGSGNAAFNRIALRSGSNNGNNSWEFDEVRLGQTWSDVIEVPEPSSLAFLLAALAAAARLRAAR
jgi:hypothetical protein